MRLLSWTSRRGVGAEKRAQAEHGGSNPSVTAAGARPDRGAWIGALCGGVNSRKLKSVFRSAASVNMIALLAANLVAPLLTAPAADAAGGPGTSLGLFNHPYYTCVKNYYVATNGSDANNGTSPGTPWLTLQHANDTGRTAGDCVNVAPALTAMAS